METTLQDSKLKQRTQVHWKIYRKFIDFLLVLIAHYCQNHAYHSLQSNKIYFKKYNKVIIKLETGLSSYDQRNMLFRL